MAKCGRSAQWGGAPRGALGIFHAGQRPSVPRGLAAFPVDQLLLLLLRQGLPLLPVPPAALQQGPAVLRHVGQGLERGREEAGGRRPGRAPFLSCPPPLVFPHGVHTQGPQEGVPGSTQVWKSGRVRPALWGTTGLVSVWCRQLRGVTCGPAEWLYARHGEFSPKAMVRVSSHSKVAPRSAFSYSSEVANQFPRNRQAECDQHPATGLGHCMAPACPLKTHRDTVRSCQDALRPEAQQLLAGASGKRTPCTLLPAAPRGARAAAPCGSLQQHASPVAAEDTGFASQGTFRARSNRDGGPCTYRTHGVGGRGPQAYRTHGG